MTGSKPPVQEIAMPWPETSTIVLAARPGGKSLLMSTNDPWQVWMELMELFEAMCPGWPQREVFRDGGQMRL